MKNVIRQGVLDVKTGIFLPLIQHIERITDMTESMELDGQKKKRKKKLGPISEVSMQST